MAAKYDYIGKTYNATRRADPFLFGRMLHHLNPRREGNYLDIGCGTGNYTIEFDKKGFRFTGVDPSLEMLTKARLRSSRIEWVEGSAEEISFKRDTFDGIIASLTLHHWKNLQKGFSQLHSLLKPGGSMVIFTATPEQMEGYWLTHYFPKMLRDSAVLMPAMHTLENIFTAVGFTIKLSEPYFIQRDLQDLFLYSGKHEPERYLDPVFRSGISSFADVARSEEIKKGLKLLKEDIDSGTIAEVMNSYENDAGDYLFLKVKKNVS
jgi:ubiquinone/menaquinone biosynthesis C-methylase UbiE